MLVAPLSMQVSTILITPLVFIAHPQQLLAGSVISLLNPIVMLVSLMPTHVRRFAISLFLALFTSSNLSSHLQFTTQTLASTVHARLCPSMMVYLLDSGLSIVRSGRSCLGIACPLTRLVF